MEKLKIKKGTLYTRGTGPSRRRRKSKGYMSKMGQDLFVDHIVLRERPKGVYVDIGAHDGWTTNNTLFFDTERQWFGICVEPVPYLFEKLSKRRTSVNYNCCVAERFKKVEFAIYRFDQKSRIVGDHNRRKIKEFQKKDVVKKIIVVEAVPLSYILKKNKISLINFLSIDVENEQLNVLKGINWDRTTINCICVEIWKYNNNNSTNLFLKNKGFIPVAKYHLDYIYVRKDFLPKTRIKFI